jgi:uncharacterized phage protein (TIGR01671 family)
MRNIKFRGLTPDGIWVYGSLLQSEIDTNQIAVKCAIVEQFADNYDCIRHEVIPESVGEYTGLKDKNEKEIFDGDFVVWKVNDIVRTAAVYFDELQACFWMGKDKDLGHLVLNDWMRGEYEVIGNIRQNPELL